MRSVLKAQRVKCFSLGVGVDRATLVSFNELVHAKNHLGKESTPAKREA